MSTGPNEAMMESQNSAAANQLPEWYQQNKDKIDYAKNSAGIDLVNKDASITVGRYGPIVLSDWQLVEQLQHFNRERIPERVVHARGAGAFGYFQVTNDISQYTTSKVFERVGKKTPVAVRFSKVAGNLGSSDTVRDPRGFAVKFYTEEGIWDLVGNNTPIFFMRDPILFPMFIHSQKQNPVTNTRDWNMFWDWISLRPESVHQVMFLFSDRGIPDGYRHMHGFGSHTFSLIGKNRKLTWVKFIFKTDQGIKNLDPAKADEIAGKDPEYAIIDLYNAIETGQYPWWTLYIQVMSPERVKTVNFDPFDITKVWPHRDFPLIEVGKMVLNKNPSNTFAEVEQIAFSPNNITPGIGASPDRLLQGRLFAYQDAHRYRLGANFQQVPVNHPLTQPENFQRDGLNVIDNKGGAPNYHPNSFGGPNVYPSATSWTTPPMPYSGLVDHYDIGDDDNFTQPKVFWNKVLNEGEKSRLVDNLAGTIKLATEDIQRKAVELFSNVDEVFGNRLRQKIAEKVVHL